jgi:rRNA-processing protein FCF1
MSNTAISTLLSGSGSRSLLLDSNLLLLWITARYDLRLLATFKRVQMFTQDDAILLAWIIDQFHSVVTTTHVVTEASNLGNSLSSYSRLGWFTALSEFSTNTLDETHPLNTLASCEEFIRFGVTDCALSNLSSKYRVLTTDHRLSNYAREHGMPVLNFNDLRQMI